MGVKENVIAIAGRPDVKGKALLCTIYYAIDQAVADAGPHPTVSAGRCHSTSNYSPASGIAQRIPILCK